MLSHLVDPFHHLYIFLGIALFRLQRLETFAVWEKSLFIFVKYHNESLLPFFLFLLRHVWRRLVADLIYLLSKCSALIQFVFKFHPISTVVPSLRLFLDSLPSHLLNPLLLFSSWWLLMVPLVEYNLLVTYFHLVLTAVKNVLTHVFVRF